MASCAWSCAARILSLNPTHYLLRSRRTDIRMPEGAPWRAYMRPCALSNPAWTYEWGSSGLSSSGFFAERGPVRACAAGVRLLVETPEQGERPLGTRAGVAVQCLDPEL